MSYLVVTTLDLADAPLDRVMQAERGLKALGLRRALLDDHAQPHLLPWGTYAGVFDGESAHDLRRSVKGEVDGLLGRLRLSAGAQITIGGDWRERKSAA